MNQLVALIHRFRYSNMCTIQFSSVAQLCLTLCDPVDYMYAHSLTQDRYWGYNGK